MRWRPCSPDPMRRMRAAPTFACARRSSPWGRRFPSPPFRDPAMQARPPAAQGFQTRRAWQRGRPPAGSGQPVPRGMGLPHKSPRQTTGNRPSNEAQTASFKGRFALWFPFLCGRPPPFRLPAPPGTPCGCESRGSPQKGGSGRSRDRLPRLPALCQFPGFSSPLLRRLRASYAALMPATEASSPVPASAAGLVTPVTGGPFVLSTVLITVKPDVSSPSMLRRISAPPATKRSPSP